MSMGQNLETSRNYTYVKDALAVTLLYVYTDLDRSGVPFGVLMIPLDLSVLCRLVFSGIRTAVSRTDDKATTRGRIPCGIRRERVR
jgi:hypothetical protein